MITILERSDDAEGRATKAWLDARSIQYVVIGVAANPDIDFLLHSLGFAAQHVVEVKTSVGVSRFENHRPDLLEALCGTVAA